MACRAGAFQHRRRRAPALLHGDARSLCQPSAGPLCNRSRLRGEAPDATVDGKPIGADAALLHRLPTAAIAEEFEAAAADRHASDGTELFGAVADHHLV